MLCIRARHAERTSFSRGDDSLKLSRERNDRVSYTGNRGRVPHISLVFREMWDTTVLDPQLYRCH
jgi:hypothetical protein